MAGKRFDEKAYNAFYSDESFLMFLCSYFTTYNLDIDTQLVCMDLEIDDPDYLAICLRIFLSHIQGLTDALEELERYISYTYKEEKKTYIEEIRGRLNISQYVREYTNSVPPRRYPCIVKQKSYDTPENRYTMWVVYRVLNVIDAFKKQIKIITNKKNVNGGDKKYTEWVWLEIYETKLEEVIRKKYWRDIYASIEKEMAFASDSNDYVTDDLLTSIEKRNNQGKIRNYDAYENVFVWAKQAYSNGAFNITGSETSISQYNEDFRDTLFELWCLYKIKSSFVDELKCELIDEGNINDTKEYIFHLRTSINTKKILKKRVRSGVDFYLFYQKGEGLYWSDKRNEDRYWKYIHKVVGDDSASKEKALVGKPDISVSYVAKSGDTTYFIDVKNRERRNAAYSEEIYKMIGYYSNFREHFCHQNDKRAILLFRNDEQKHDIHMKSKGNELIRIMTISPVTSNAEGLYSSNKQFENCCKYILDGMKEA